ncbi:NADH-quinone oxidoreductase subunit I [Piscinibacter sp.]|jgi:formate hydrogenlyase subunit 6/NADH:ubiquinone oxidoreductase subunit I|uniref:NADH-quinone oxidoreductase subunit I n=1 Tax=Piscinibacter sp. TaxID=1903157 RepID=UPI00355A4692
MSVVPEIQATRCVRYRFRYSECRRCDQACPHDAIRLSDEGVAIASERCRGCGLCISACRTETFTAASLAPLGLIDKARGRTSFSIACAPSGADADSNVPCLGALGPALLAYLVKQGIELSLAGSDHCVSCVHGARGSEQLAINLDAVESLRVADRAGQWAGISLPQRASAKNTQGDDRRAARRQFFRRFSNVGDGAPRSKPSTNGPATPLRAIRAARVTPSAQRDLLQMLGLSDAEMPLAAHPSLPAGDIRLEPGCTGCEACARACPTGALQVRENGTAWALGFEAALCVACGVCVETCQPRVLHLREAVAAVQFAKREAVALHGLPKRRCTRCDRSFITATDSALCDVCAGDEQDFDAIFG